MRFEDLTEVLLKIEVLNGVTLCPCIYQISAACSIQGAQDSIQQTREKNFKRET
jgi:hypothetical protein